MFDRNQDTAFLIPFPFAKAGKRGCERQSANTESEAPDQTDIDPIDGSPGSTPKRGESMLITIPPFSTWPHSGVPNGRRTPDMAEAPALPK